MESVAMRDRNVRAPIAFLHGSSGCGLPLYSQHLGCAHRRIISCLQCSFRRLPQLPTRQRRTFTYFFPFDGLQQRANSRRPCHPRRSGKTTLGNAIQHRQALPDDLINAEFVSNPDLVFTLSPLYDAEENASHQLDFDGDGPPPGQAPMESLKRFMQWAESDANPDCKKYLKQIVSKKPKPDTLLRSRGPNVCMPSNYSKASTFVAVTTRPSPKSKPRFTVTFDTISASAVAGKVAAAKAYYVLKENRAKSGGGPRRAEDAEGGDEEALVGDVLDGFDILGFEAGPDGAFPDRLRSRTGPIGEDGKFKCLPPDEWKLPAAWRPFIGMRVTWSAAAPTFAAGAEV